MRGRVGIETDDCYMLTLVENKTVGSIYVDGCVIVCRNIEMKGRKIRSSADQTEEFLSDAEIHRCLGIAAFRLWFSFNASRFLATESWRARNLPSRQRHRNGRL